MKKQRSPFSLNMIELVIALVAGIVTWFGFRYFLWGTGPWPFYDLEYYRSEPLPLWFIEGRQHLFNLFAIPMSIGMSISVVFFMRGVFNQKLQYFSRLSNLSMAWPILLFFTLNTLSFLNLFCLPLGLFLSVVPFADSYKTESKWGGIIALVWNVTWLIFGGLYFGQWWKVYGD